MPLPSFSHDSEFWRKLARWGAQRGPEWWIRYSPPVFGVAAAALVPSARANVVRNLRRVRGERGPVQDAVDVARTFSGFAGCLTEVLTTGSANYEPPQIEFVGGDHVEVALHGGAGLIFVTAHTAGWEAMGPRLFEHYGRKVVLVMDRERDKGALSIQDEARNAPGVAVQHTDGDPFSSLPLLRHLRAGEVVAIQVDRTPKGMRACPVTLLGGPATMPEGPFHLARLSGAPIIPVFSARTGFRRYLVRTYPPVTIAKNAGAPDFAHAAQGVADTLTSFLREHPTQWFHFDDSW